MLKLSFYGQACFAVTHKDTVLIFDPYLSANPAKAIMPCQIHPDYIFVTHGHQDHIGDTVELAADGHAVVITTAEIGRARQKVLRWNPCTSAERGGFPLEPLR